MHSSLAWLALASLALGLATVVSPAHADVPPLVPRAVLFGNPERTSPQLSPDGKRLAYLAPKDGVMNLWIRTIGKTDDRPVTLETARPLRAYRWAMSGKQLIYRQDKGGDENYHLYAVDPDKNVTTNLTPHPNIQASVVADDAQHPDTLIVQYNQRNPQAFDAYRLNLKTDKAELVAQNPGDIVGWVADADLKVRAGAARSADGGQSILVRDSEQAPWRTLLTVSFGESASAIGFTKDGKSLYVTTDKGVNTARLYQVALTTGAMELLHAREDVDLGDVLLHPTRYTVEAVAYNRSRLEWVGLTPEVRADLDALKKVTDGDFYLVGNDTANKEWLVAYTRDNGSPSYYTYNRASKKAELLFTAQPKLDAYTLAKTTPLDVTAQDGLTLPCYLTLPAGVAPKNLPLVLFPHGGPWARDTWGYSPFVQWLANRGYAVLQVNFRGSTGYGKKFLNAGNREWAKKMQTDLSDAVDRVVKDGTVDPKRVAIMGGSYGGYATLVGMSMTPDRYVCGVELFGPSNITTLFASIPPYWAPIKSEFLLRVGDPDKEPNFIKNISPLYFADKITRPLLIAQGANDARVKPAESEQIVKAMRTNKGDVTYLVFPDEGHGFARPENNLKFAAAAEAFLAKYLGGRAEPAHEGEAPPIVE